MTKVSPQVYEEYAVLDAKIRELTIQKDAIKDQIMSDMEASGCSTAETPFGKFLITQLKTWEYTPAVSQLEEMYKATKAKEQSTGAATYTEKPSLRFTQIKL